MICSDEKTIPGMITLVNSILKHSSCSVFFHLFTSVNEVELVTKWLLHYHPKIKMKVIPFSLAKNWKIQFQKSKKIHRKELLSHLNFARFFLNDLLSNFSGRLIYLDDDVLILDDIKELLLTSIQSNHIISASFDELNTLDTFINFNNPTIRKISSLRPKDKAFNVGVFVCDLSRWRHYNITNQILSWASLNRENNIYGSQAGRGVSQPPMLLALHNKVSPLDPQWHVRHLGWWYGNKYHSTTTLKRAKLLHWNGRWKPWIPNHTTRCSFLWHSYYLKDPFGKYNIEKISII